MGGKRGRRIGEAGEGKRERGSERAEGGEGKGRGECEGGGVEGGRSGEEEREDLAFEALNVCVPYLCIDF